MFRSRPIPDMPAAVALGRRPRILVVKLASLGDMLLALPALRALRLRYPDARIDTLTTEGTAPLLRDSPLVNAVYTLNKYAFDAPADTMQRLDAAREALELGRRLRATRYDAALLLHHLTLPFGRLKYRALIEVFGARSTAGLDNGWGHLLDVRVPDHGFGWRHESEYYLAVAAALDASLPLDEQTPRMADLGWDDIAVAAKLEPPLVALHPGSGGYSVARRWPAERWADLAHELHMIYGAAITLIGGPDEQAVLDDIVGRLDSPTWLTVANTMKRPRELAVQLSHCALLVANDSFPMHLASTMGTPVVAVFGPSNAKAWGPYAPRRPEMTAIVRRPELQCSPCFYRGHALGTPQGCATRPCLTELPLQPVLAAARHLLARQAVAAAQGG